MISQEVRVRVLSAIDGACATPNLIYNSVKFALTFGALKVLKDQKYLNDANESYGQMKHYGVNFIRGVSGIIHPYLAALINTRFKVLV